MFNIDQVPIHKGLFILDPLFCFRFERVQLVKERVKCRIHFRLREKAPFGRHPVQEFLIIKPGPIKLERVVERGPMLVPFQNDRIVV